MNKQSLKIIEVHVEGYTKQCPFIPKRLRGKFLGLCHPFMVNHMKSLGVNTIQIMPIMKKDHTYWGYGTTDWLKHEDSYGTEKELKKMVEVLQKKGFKIVLDVVFNHVAAHQEGIYYYDWNVTGCENTVDVKKSLPLIKKAMKYWLEDIGADGFRYDLAGVLGREGGDFHKDAEFFKYVEATYPDKIHIAEPYDLAAQNLGQFPEHWYELNHHARDTIRHGHPYMGTSAITADRAINYVTVHDGFTLRDLTEYNHKHNWMNGEGNRDGVNDNKSYNHGVEGPSNDARITHMRNEHKHCMGHNLRASSKNWLILQGDELNNSQMGCNNGYLYGNQVTWVDWSQYQSYFVDIYPFKV